ncbi:MAG: adenylate/guanylate cyclase domain-containing protein [Fimbriimonadaceae bacterium]
MLALAERLRHQSGGVLDDEAILAVAEASGVPEEHVRVAVSRLGPKKRRSPIHAVRNAFLSLEPDVRRHVITGFLATVSAIPTVVGSVTGDQYGLFSALALLLAGAAMWNVSVSRDDKTAIASGALLGGVFFLARSLFALVLGAPMEIGAGLLVPFVLGGAVGGFALRRLSGYARTKLGMKDPGEERRELLRQLVEIQDRLRAGERSTAFLSLDIVGSTKMKQVADPLSVEYTFTEYHKFVEAAARRFGGQVHSTAGDGVTCAFLHPHQAFRAAKFIQGGLLELNTLHNKIGLPIRLRAGIHTGTVMTGFDQDITKVNFAHVIDVAAHVQKLAPEGGVAITTAAAEMLPGGPRAVGGQTVSYEDIVAHVWLPRRSAAHAAPLPPIPGASGSPAT